MKYLLTFCCVIFAWTAAQAQFRPTDKELMIVVSDGTHDGKNSEIQPKQTQTGNSNVPTSYDQVTTKGGLTFTDPIRSLGMTDCIQAAAFLERPEYGLTGYMLIFSVNDSIGGKQATLTMPDGKTYPGVYRLIRQKVSVDEPLPAGMANYKISGTFFLLGIS